MRGCWGWRRLCGWARLPAQKRPSGRVGRRHRRPACIAIDAFVLFWEGSFYEALAENGWLWCLYPPF